MSHAATVSSLWAMDVYDYTATRGRDGPAKFLEGYQGYLQADCLLGLQCVFQTRTRADRARVLDARRYFFKALESDQQHMRATLHLIARVYAVEDRAQGLTPGGKIGLRQRLSAPLLEKLHKYLLDLREQVLPKSPSGAAVRYALNQWEALTRFLEDGELEIDNGATERANRDIAIGRGNWTFFGSDNGGNTAAVLLSFIAMCKRNAVEPFAWFRDVLSRLATHRSTGSRSCSHTTGKPSPLPPGLISRKRLGLGVWSARRFTRRLRIYETHSRKEVRLKVFGQDGWPIK